MLRPFMRSRRTVAEVPAAHESEASARSPVVEPLEARRMFAAAPHFTSFISDNRGEVVLITQKSLKAVTVNSRSVQLYSVGLDGIPLTADDVKQRIRVRWNESNRRISIKTFGLPANTTYWVKVSAKQVTATTGELLDGEFNGAGSRTGNNVQGGDFLMVSKRDKGLSPVARFSTFYGAMNVVLNKTDTPGHVANLFHYANEAAWDGTFFHRSHLIGGNPANGIIQGGAFFVDAANTVQEIHTEPPIANEFKHSNVRGTISMAKSADPNSATNQFFFNVGDNSADLDDPANSGGFTVFGALSGVSSFATLDALAALPVAPESEVPINDLDAFLDRGTFDPSQDVVFVRRVAILNKNSALIVP